MSQFLTILGSGIAAGALYALIGLGLVLVYRASRVLNFAHGDMVTVLAFVAYSLSVTARLPYATAVVILVIAGACFGSVTKMLVDRVGERSSRGTRVYGLYDDAALLNIVIGTVALSLIFEGLQGAIWGTSVRSVPTPLSSVSWRLGGFYIAGVSVLDIGSAAVAFAAVFALLKFTAVGRGAQATFDNPYAAVLVGIRVSTVYLFSWATAMGVGGLAAILIAPTVGISQSSLVSFAFVAFLAIILGGLSSVWGAALGGVMVGIVQSVVSAYWSSQVEQLVLLVLTLVVLFIRPYGILSRSAQHATRV